MSVDPGYSSKPEEYNPQAARILKKRGLDWPNALAPRGFADITQTFNATGYGSILVDDKGIVRAVGLHGTEVEEVVPKVLKRPLPGKPRD